MSSTCAKVYQIPGPQGPAGADGTNGTNGAAGGNAYTNLNMPAPGLFTMPGELINVNATVDSTAWMAIGQIVYIQSMGHFEVVSVLSATQVTLKNLMDSGNDAYLTNVAPGIQAADNSVVSPAGMQGPGGIASSAYLEIANNLGDAGLVAATCRTNLGATAIGNNLFTVASSGAVTFVRVNADNSVTLRSASDFRTDLGLVIGTNVQAYDATLQSIAALGTAADRYAYTTAVDTWAEGTITSAGRALLDDASAAAQRGTLGLTLATGGYLIFQQQEASATDGGTFNTGAWRTVGLNTEVVDTGNNGSIAANQITLAQGTYRARWRVVGYEVGNYQSRLYNVTNATPIGYGTNATSAAADSSSTLSLGEYRFAIAAATEVVRLEAYCQTNRATDGFGRANSFGGTEIYSSIELIKEAG